jgi:hypothetical protein
MARVHAWLARAEPYDRRVKRLVPVVLIAAVAWMLYLSLETGPGATSEHAATDGARVPQLQERELAAVDVGSTRTEQGEAARPSAATAEPAPAPRRRVSVRVVDRAGAPVSGAAVAFCAAELGEWQIDQSLLTDEDGTAEFQDLGYIRDEQRRLRVTTSLVRCDPEFVEFTLAELPDLPLSLVVKASCTIEVRATDAAGRPLGIPVTLWIATDEDAHVAWPFGLGLHDRVSITSGAGTARFECVGLGLPLVADAHVQGAVFVRRPVEPVNTPGLLIHVDVPLERANPLLRATLVDENGRPLAHWSGSAWLRRGEAIDSYSIGRFETDELGRAEILVSIAYRDLSAVDQVAIVLSAPNELDLRADAPLPLARRTTPGLQRDEHDFGVLVCTADSFFCSGRVVDDEQRPVAGACVSITIEEPAWSSVRDPRVPVDTQGRFSVSWAGEELELTLQAAAGAARKAAPRTVGRGERDLVFTLPSGAALGALEGTVLLPDGISLDDFDVRITRDSPDGSSVDCSCTTSASGGFVVREALAGEYGVHIEWLSSVTVLADVRGLVVRAGETTHAAPIDVRDSIHVLRVELVDEDGAPLVDGRVCAFRDGKSLGWAECDASGVAVLPLEFADVEVVASAPGFGPRRAAAAAGRVRLELARGVNATLVGPALDARASDFELRLNFSFAGPEDQACEASSVPALLDARGKGTATFGLAGRYQLFDARLVHRTTGAEFELELGAPLFVSIRAEGGEHAVDLPSAALDAALARAAAR